MSDDLRRVHLAAHFPGVNNTTVWRDPRSGSQIDFASFEHVARTAERGCFDFFFLAEGLRLREHRGEIFDLDVVGRPDAVTVLAALSSVTEHLGLVATVNVTFNEPYELARKLASLDVLSGGRAGWNVVTSSDAFTGANFRRGGYLPYRERYERARRVVSIARSFWDSWAPHTLANDATAGVYADDAAIAVVDHRDEHFDVHGRSTVPRSPQGHPVLIQAGDSGDGRDFGAEIADVIFSRHVGWKAGAAFYADLKARVEAHGRDPEHVKVMPGVTYALGDSEDEARDRARQIRLQQVGPEQARFFLEQLWNRDLSDHDVDGPLPSIDPDVDGDSLTKGRVAIQRDPIETAQRWRAIASDKGLTSRELVIEVTGRQTFVGTPSQVAAKMADQVAQRVADGFILVPHLVPGGLDEFVDRVVPELQDRGAFRTAYDGPTLRDHLALPARIHPSALVEAR